MPAVPLPYATPATTVAARAGCATHPTAPVAASAYQPPPASFLKTAKRKRRKYDHESFPQKLHRLILEARANGKDHIIRFNVDGSKFEVVKSKDFEEQLLPNYFRTKQASSFKRLLRMYGFCKVQGTWLQGTFEHPLFHRDYPEIAKQMERVEPTGNDTKKKPRPR